MGIPRFDKAGFSAISLAACMGLVMVGCGSGSEVPQEQTAEPVRSTVRISGLEVSILPALAEARGEFEREGLDVILVKGEDVKPKSSMMQGAMHRGELDASVHWFQHAMFGVAHDLPLVGVMVLNDAPAMEVMVANRVKDQVKSGADFAGRNVAEGAGYATKSVITNYIARQAGLPLGSYTPVMIEQDGRREAVLQGLERGEVDVMTFMEPMTTDLRNSGLVSPLYDLTSGESTARALGAPWIAQTLLFTPDFIETNPEVVQKMVNALARTLRFFNESTPEEIADALPVDYFVKKDKASVIEGIRRSKPTFASDIRFTREALGQAIDATQGAPFDSSDQGVFRGRVRDVVLDVESLYTNEFADRAAGALD